MTWYAQENDVIGGYIVTNLNLPASQHDSRPCGNPAKHGYIIADMMKYSDAILVAKLLNEAEIEREHPV